MEQAVIFVVQGSKLEAQALLLATSLTDTFANRSLRKVAFVPETGIPLLADHTRALFDRCEVEIAPLSVPEDTWAKAYPHGNKILACQQFAALRGGRPTRVTFLDTDMICRRNFLGAEFETDKVLAVAEGLPTWGKDGESWERAYAHFGLPMPQDRVRLNRGRKLVYPPYFNAGLISIPDPSVSPEGKNFADCWLADARMFDRDCPVANKRPWLDQITLPLSIYRHGFDYVCLSDEFNHSISERARLGRARKARIIHYHRGKFLSAVPAILGQVMASAMNKVPTAMVAPMVEFISHHLMLDTAWQAHTGSQAAAPAQVAAA